MREIDVLICAADDHIKSTYATRIALQDAKSQQHMSYAYTAASKPTKPMMLLPADLAALCILGCFTTHQVVCPVSGR